MGFLADEISTLYSEAYICPICGKELQRAIVKDSSGNYIQERKLSCSCGYEEAAYSYE
jgi:uncharacterized protein (DUF2225 family)